MAKNTLLRYLVIINKNLVCDSKNIVERSLQHRERRKQVFLSLP